MFFNIIKISLIIFVILAALYGVALLVWHIHWRRKVKRLREERRVAYEAYKKTDDYQEYLKRMEWAREMVKKAEAYRVANMEAQGLDPYAIPEPPVCSNVYDDEEE